MKTIAIILALSSICIAQSSSSNSSNAPTPLCASATYSGICAIETLSIPWVAPSGINGNYLPLAPATFCTGTTNQGTGGISNYCEEMTNTAPYIDGFLMATRWPIGFNSDGGIDTGFEILTVPASNPPGASQYNFTNLDLTVLGPLSAFTCGAKLGRPHPCWFSMKLGPSQAAAPNKAQVPDYVYAYGSGSWADLVCPAWQSGATYLANQCAQYPLGSFYQSTDGISHVAHGNSGPLSDGGSWSGPTAHAAPLDVGSNTTQTYTTNTIPCSTNNTAPCPGISNANSNNCGTGAQTCTTAMLEVGTEAIWETPLWVAWVNASNALNHFIGTKPYGANYVYFRPGLFADGTSFNPSETSLQTLTGNSQTNLETVVANFVASALPQMKQQTNAVGALQDCVVAGNTTTQDALLQASCATGADMMGIQGIQNNDLLNWWKGSTITNSWNLQFTSYNMKAYHEQPIAASNTTHCTPLVSDPGFYCTTFMLPMIAMLRNNHPVYYEIFQSEADCAFDPLSNGTGCNGTAPNAGWAAVIYAALAQGLPFPLGFGVSSGR